MTQLFDVSTDNVELHLKNLLADGELSREATTEESSVVQSVGSREVQHPVTLYNLAAIHAVGTGYLLRAEYIFLLICLAQRSSRDAAG